MKPYKDIPIIFTLLLFVGCFNRQDKSEKISQNYLNNLETKLSGKKFQFTSGNFTKGKTYAFLVDKENWILPDSAICADLEKNNILAKDSAELKTVTLIYYPDLWNQIYTEKNLTYKICFVDLSTFVIKKKIEVLLNKSFYESKNVFSEKIIQEFKH